MTVPAGMILRPGRIEDLAAVLALERETAEAPRWLAQVYAAILLPAVDDTSFLRRYLIVAHADGGLVGFAVGRAAGMEAELESVAVAQRARRLGLGRELCRAVMDWCRRQGASRMDLEVRARSVGARTLYESLGFATVGIRTGYYHDPADDALLMRLTL